eukprot:CAMPEP_0178744006 /NCGR_PEP_ID=MMETSP0744-20121128/6516_1 /TAXON_ID=913974 /ORGANISM="Nitzschia punctata, Strain CCMP561" /LENGTH=75 /DNA_ID=CAMNT_0020397063 /DNA_START=425 /DNA_END=652 /DNA_ORIENTATION=-
MASSDPRHSEGIALCSVRLVACSSATADGLPREGPMLFPSIAASTVGPIADAANTYIHVCTCAKGLERSISMSGV